MRTKIRLSSHVTSDSMSYLTSSQIEEAHDKAYPLVIDNVHNPVASPIAEVSPESVILTWRNFPDHTGNNVLYSVVKENLESLWTTGLF